MLAAGKAAGVLAAWASASLSGSTEGPGLEAAAEALAGGVPTLVAGAHGTLAVTSVRWADGPAGVPEVGGSPASPATATTAGPQDLRLVSTGINGSTRSWRLDENQVGNPVVEAVRGRQHGACVPPMVTMLLKRCLYADSQADTSLAVILCSALLAVSITRIL